MTNQNEPFAPAPESVEDAMKLMQNAAAAWAKGQEAWAAYIQGNAAHGPKPMELDPFHVAPAYAEYMRALMENPEKIAESTLALWSSYAQLWRNSWMRAMGAEAEPIAQPAPGDKRFKDAEWSENVVFDHLKQSYLLVSNFVQESVKAAEGLSKDDRAKVEFFNKRFAEALSPANVLAFNPEAIRTTLEQKGENLVRGMEHILEDLQRGGGELQIKQVDLSAFEVGKNVATTPGKVVYRNDIIELIQYDPSTEQVHAKPFLFVPPWINKFYILDLNEQKSMVRWLVAQGHTVFVISWINPAPGFPTKVFDDYVQNGFFDALEAVLQETGEAKANVAGYCIGGTMVSCALAYMGKTGDDRVNSATLFTAQTDFSDAGELKVFIDSATIKGVEAMAKAEGNVFQAGHMAGAFNLMRSSELVWSYVINNYMLGKDPTAFDMLYWNADATRMPAALHVNYLTDFYRDNKFAKGAYKVFGETVTPGDIKVPVYSICAKEDHIAPAASVFRGVKLFGGQVRLVVGGSGHIAGIINPPNKVKYQYWTNDLPQKDWPETLEVWLEGATETPGSWWPDWKGWLAKRSGRKVAARTPGAVLGALMDAPGSYVKVRSDNLG